MNVNANHFVSGDRETDRQSMATQRNTKQQTAALRQVKSN